MIHAVGFAPSDHDPTLFIHLPPGRHTLLLYAKDMMITRDDLEYINHDKKQLGKKFQMSDLGPLSYFLWIEFFYSEREIAFLNSNTFKTLLLVLESLRIERCNTFGSSLVASSY